MADVGVNGTTGQCHKSKVVEEEEEGKEEKRGEGRRRRNRSRPLEMGKPGVHIVIHHLHKEHNGEVREVRRGAGDDTDGTVPRNETLTFGAGGGHMEHGAWGGRQRKMGAWRRGPDVCAPKRVCVVCRCVCLSVSVHQNVQEIELWAGKVVDAQRAGASVERSRPLSIFAFAMGQMGHAFVWSTYTHP